MKDEQSKSPSPAKWALIGGIAIGLGATLNGYQQSGMIGFSIGYAIGPAMIGAVAGWIAAHVKRSLSQK